MTEGETATGVCQLVGDGDDDEDEDEDDEGEEEDEDEGEGLEAAEEWLLSR